MDWNRELECRREKNSLAELFRRVFSILRKVELVSLLHVACTHQSGFRFHHVFRESFSIESCENSDVLRKL